jgi:hypothetical protein
VLYNIVTSLFGNRIDRTVVAKELGKCVSGVTFPHSDQYGISLVTGLLRQISAATQRLQEHNLWKYVFSLRSPHRSLCSGVPGNHTSSYSSEIQLRDRSRNNKIEEKPVEAKTSGMGHGRPA